MPPAPLVSIIVPSRDTGRFISATITSVLAQTFPDWEMLIIDDGSVDDTPEVVARTAGGDLGKRVIWERTPGGLGPARARNQAIKHARGRYIAFLDSDDLWYPRKLERQIAFMEKTGACLSHAAYELMEEDGAWLDRIRVPPPRIGYEGLLRCNVIGCLTAMYDSERLGKVFMPDIIKRQDHGLWLRILADGHEAWAMDDVLGAYRIRSRSVSSNKIASARWQWRLYRDVEQMNRMQAAWYFSRYTWNGLVRSERERPMTERERAERPWPGETWRLAAPETGI